MGLFGPSFEDVWNGAQTPGTIVGIRLRQKNEDESTYLVEEYAVELETGELLGIRQKLHPVTEVRLGMPVAVARKGKAAAIRYGQGSSTFWKQVKPPERGIDDPVSLGGLTRRLWKPCTIEVVSIGTKSGMLGLTTVNELRVVVTPAGGGAPHETLISKVTPAHYAAHLFRAGVTLPGFFDGPKARIDWQSAALADPGVGVASPFSQPGEVPGSTAAPAASELSLPGFDRLTSRLTEKIVGASVAAAGGDANAGAAADDPVSWQTFLAVSAAIKNAGYGSAEAQDAIAQQHGVPAGEWDAVNRRWMGRLMADWRLGAEYGQAMS